VRLIYITFISLLLSACTSTVNFDYDRAVNFNSFTTYTINKEPVRVTGDTRINSPFMTKRVVAELNITLANKGFEKSNEKAELEVNYFLDIKPELETEDSGFVSLGFGASRRHSAVGLGFNIPIGEVSNIDKLVLTIDFVSVKTKKLIWRGSLGYHLYEGATPETYTTLVKKLVAEILKNFPPNNK